MNTFFWYDLMTRDPKAASEFYGTVMGWTTASAGVGDHDYSIFSYAGLSLGGLIPLPEDIADKNLGAAWRGYIHVSDVDATLKQIVEAGGVVCRAPWDIPETGRVAVAQDPIGAKFVIMTPQPRANETAHLMAFGSIGTVAWHELHSTDWPVASSFYSRVFGWRMTGAMDMGSLGTYQIFADQGSDDIGGMMQQTSDVDSPFWLFYFKVDALTPRMQLVTQHGGIVETEPHEVPGGMWITHCVDPQGGHFSLLSAQR